MIHACMCNIQIEITSTTKMTFIIVYQKAVFKANLGSVFVAF